MKKISFPKKEYKDYLKRLNKGQFIYTTRVSNEVGKYHLHQVYDSIFGALKVISIKHFHTLYDHPFYEELTKEQKKEIDAYQDYRGIDLIELKKIDDCK